MQTMVTRLVILFLVLICGVGLFFAVDMLETAPLKQAQEVAQQRFGTDLLKLCQGATESHGALPANSRISAINSDENTVFDAYDSAIPSSMRATGKSDVTILLCLKEDKVVFDTSHYGKPSEYTCTQYERDLTGYLVDARTGKTLDYKKFAGQMPADCPDSTDHNVTEVGDVPLASAIIAWLSPHTGGEA